MSSSLATRSSALFRSVDDRSTPLARWPSSSITLSQWARLEVAALATPSISWPTEVKPSCTRTMMLWICWAPSPALLARSEASPLSPIRLPTWPSRSRTVSPIRCVACRVASARLFTSLATTAKPLPAAPARAASMVAFSASRLVCLAIASIDPDTLATCASAVPTEPRRRSMRPTASINSAICWTAVSTAARDWVISPTAAEVAVCTALRRAWRCRDWPRPWSRRFSADGRTGRPGWIRGRRLPAGFPRRRQVRPPSPPMRFES